MIKDFLISFKDNFKEKTRNPFLGTYIIVWLIRNWELVYTIFNFDNNQKLIDKVGFIKNYYSNNDFLYNLWTNVYWSFGLLLLTYLLLNLSRIITNLSEKQLTPWIYKITDSKSIVLKTEYNRIRSDRDELQFRLDQERELKSKLEIRIKNLESEITELKKPNFKVDKTKETTFNFKTDKDVNRIFINKLKEKDLIRDFLRISVMINKGDFINNDYDPKNYFIELGLITYDSDSRDFKSKKYKLTEDGENLLRELRLE